MRSRAYGRWLFLSGLLTAMAVSFDALSAFIAASICAIAFVRTQRKFVFFGLGVAVPVIITALLDYQIAKTILPPYTITSGYDFPGSAFPTTIGGNGVPDDYAAYAFRMFVGGQGLFAYNPLLLFALAGAVAVAFQRQHALWVESLSVLVGFVLMSIYLAVATGNYGGNAYGERWFVPVIPVLYSFIFFVPPLASVTWKSFSWILFLPLLALSALSTWQGIQAPWQYIQPPLQLTRSGQFPVLGFKWNIW
jgi:hypothetical protein